MTEDAIIQILGLVMQRGRSFLRMSSNSVRSWDIALYKAHIDAVNMVFFEYLDS